LASTSLRVLRAGAALSQVLPPRINSAVVGTAAVAASRIPWGFGALSGLAQRRESVARHVQRIHSGRLDRRSTRRLVDETFVSYARYWAESLRLPSLNPSQIAEGITYRGFEHIEHAIQRGSGVILALPHLGGWEWAGADMARRGFEISVVVERLADPEVFEWFAGFREELGMHVIPTGADAASRCSSALADNQVLCLLCDRVVGGSAAVEVDFFGERTGLPAGPAMLGIRSGAPILPVAVYFCTTEGSHLADILPPVVVATEGRLRERVESTTQVLATDLEYLIRRAPSQWHMLQPNWPSDPGWRSDGAAPG